MRSGRAAPCLMVALGLFAALLAACTSMVQTEQATAGVGPGGGQVSTPDGSVAVRMGPSPGQVSTTVTISTPDGVPDPPAYLRPVGPAVQVEVGEQRPGSVIGLRFDPTTDLPDAQPGAPRATVANAFIALYSPDLQTWVPLASTWDPQSRMLTAVTPHFSLFRRFVVNPGRTLIDLGKRQVQVIASATTTGVELLTQAVTALLEYGWQELSGAVPEDKKAACPPVAAALPGVAATVEGSTGDIAACVVSDGGRAWLRVQNNLGIAVDLQQLPKRFGLGWNPYDERAFDDVFYLFGYAADRALGWQLLPPRSSVEVELPASGSPAGTVVVRPNYLMVVIDVLSTLLSVLPPTAEIEGPVLQESKLLVGSLESAIGAASTREEAVTVLRDGITTHLKPDGVDRANAIVDVYNCLLVLPTSFRPSTETVVNLVQRCGKPILENAGHELAGLLLGAVGVLKLPDELADFARRGNNTWVVSVADAAPTLDVHAAALRAAGGPSDTVADVQCPSPVQRPTGAMVLCTVLTRIPLDPAYVAVQVVDASGGRVDSAFVDGDRDCTAYPNWADTLLRQSGMPCGVTESGSAATGPAVDVDIRTLHVGQCYDDAIDPDQGSVTTCADSHDGEVIGTLAAPSGVTDARAGDVCRTLLGPRLTSRVDQEALSLTWSLPDPAAGWVTCRLERGTHEAPLTQPVGSG